MRFVGGRRRVGGLGLAPVLFGVSAAIYQSWCSEDPGLAVGLGFGLPAACIVMGCFGARFVDD